MPVLGLRGTGSFTVDGQRPKNWREKTLHLFPNGKAPLTAILAMLKAEKTDDPEYNWFEKALSGQRLQLNGAIADGVVTTFTVDATSGDLVGAKSLKKGTVLLVESTGEILWVSDDPSTDLMFIADRGMGSTSAAGIADNVNLLIIGTAHQEGADVPTAVTYDPVKYYNYTQIFRSSLYMTRTAQKTRLRTGDQIKEAKREALELQSIQKERAFLFGNRKEYTGGSQPQRTTMGMEEFINTYESGNIIGSIGALSESAWDGYLEQVFRYGSTEKLGLCGGTSLKVLATMAKKGGIQMTAVPTSESYGMNLVKMITPFGTLILKSHPLFNEHPVHRQNIMIIDTKNVVSRFIDDLQYKQNRQGRGVDAKADEWLEECGLEPHFAKTHMYLKGITDFAP